MLSSLAMNETECALVLAGLKMLEPCLLEARLRKRARKLRQVLKRHCIVVKKTTLPKIQLEVS